MEDLTRAELPWEQLVLCADPNRVALQKTLLEFDAQGLVDRPGHQNPETIQIPGVDEVTGCASSASGGSAASSRPQTSGMGAAGGPAQNGGASATGSRPQASGAGARTQNSSAGAAGGRPQAGRGAAAGNSRQAGGGGAAGSGAATAPGDKGKRPRTFVPTPTSSSSLLPPRQRPLAGGAKEGGRGGQSFGAGFVTEVASTVLEPKDQGRHSSGSTASAQAGQPLATGTRAPEPRDQGRHRSACTASAQTSPPPEKDSAVAPQSPPPKRRWEDSGPKPSGPEYKIPESRWQYRRPKTA
ncbi:uncharacterized protein LOC133907215 [Phragmites australis]|uniref:uncharacterized protein LOC133907215 n=1 Tax=Phragmites australis TaxID=29695 RepID=UPI002D78F8F2|nr:uncharacterized protein LOC133907215 [Phragmites australis]